VVVAQLLMVMVVVDVVVVVIAVVVMLIVVLLQWYSKAMMIQIMYIPSLFRPSCLVGVHFSHLFLRNTMTKAAGFFIFFC